MTLPEPVLAREFDLEVNTGTDAVPVQTRIGGITNISPGQSAQRTDDSDFDTDGWEAHTVVMRGKTLSVELLYKEDGASSGAMDAGQAALLALGDATGPGSKKGFTYTSPNGREFAFKASVDIAWPGGGKVDNATFTAELTISGKPTVTEPA